MWASGSRKKLKGGAEKRTRLHMACGSADLGKVASDSAPQRLWLRDRKERSQVVGEERSRLPGKGTVGEVRRGRRPSH